MRARRCVRMWDGDDGMVHLRGEFDPVTGKRIASRLRAEAAHLDDVDKTAAKDGAARRSFDQCMADALDNHGPALAPDQPLLYGPGIERGRDPSTLPRGPDPSYVGSDSPAMGQLEPLFTLS